MKILLFVMEISIATLSYDLRTKMIFFESLDVCFESLANYLDIQTIQKSEFVLSKVLVLILSHASVTIISF